MIEVKDLTDSISGADSNEDIASLIRTAYWRGVDHYRHDPEAVDERMNIYLSRWTDYGSNTVESGPEEPSGMAYADMSMKLRRVHDISLFWGRVKFRLFTPVRMKKSEDWNVTPGKKYKVSAKI